MFHQAMWSGMIHHGLFIWHDLSWLKPLNFSFLGLRWTLNFRWNSYMSSGLAQSWPEGSVISEPSFDIPTGTSNNWGANTFPWANADCLANRIITLEISHDRSHNCCEEKLGKGSEDPVYLLHHFSLMKACGMNFGRVGLASKESCLKPSLTF